MARPPRREGELLLAHDQCLGQGRQTGFDPKRTADTGRKIAREVIDPVATVHPAARPRLGTGDLERFSDLARVAEWNHRFGEPGADLPDLFDGALGCELNDVGIGGHCRRPQERSGEQEGQEGGNHSRC